MATETNSFDDVTKVGQLLKVPGLGMVPVMDSQRKNMETLVEVSEATFEAMQALKRKQTEILTQAVQGIQDFAKAMAAYGLGGAVVTNHEKRTELAREAYQKALPDMTELVDIARMSRTDALVVITQRSTQSMAELKMLTQPNK